MNLCATGIKLMREYAYAIKHASTNAEIWAKRQAYYEHCEACKKCSPVWEKVKPHDHH